MVSKMLNDIRSRIDPDGNTPKAVAPLDTDGAETQARGDAFAFAAIERAREDC